MKLNLPFVNKSPIDQEGAVSQSARIAFLKVLGVAIVITVGFYFLPIDYREGATTKLVIDIVTTLFGVFLLFVPQRKPKYLPIIYNALLLMLIIAVVANYRHQQADLAILAMPMLSFFLLSQAGGIVWSLIGFLVLLVGIFVYNVPELVNYTVHYLGIAGVIFYYQRIISTQVSIINQKNKQLEGANQKLRDEVKQRKKAEDKLRKEKDRIALIVSSMGEGLVVVNKKQEITVINPAAQRLLEIDSAQDVLGRKWTKVVKTYKDGEKISPKERSFNIALSKGETILTKMEKDHYYQTRNGERFPVSSITAPIISAGEVTGAVKVFRNVTREKREKEIIEKEVKERTKEVAREKAKLLASINSLPLGYFLIDPKHEISLMNPAAKDILGKEDWDFKSLKDTFGKHNIDISAFCAHCRGTNSTYGIDETDFKNKIIKIISVPVKVKRQIVGSVVVMEDITESKLLERNKDEFFAVASHELRTPLTAIRSNTAILEEYYSEKFKEKQLKEILDDMHTSSERLIDIVNDFLNVSHLEQGEVEFESEQFDIRGLTEKSIKSMSQAAIQKGLKLSIDKKPENQLIVKGDRTRTEQVLINLLDNAIKYTDEGSISVRIQRKGDYAQVEIEDTGVGISPKNQKLLFRKFQQAGEKVLARDVTQGTGMGLYISKLLVQKMGGKIFLLDSKPGKGSAFAFTLPLAKDK